MTADIWKEVRSIIKKKIPEHSFRMWIEPIDFVKNENGIVTLSCPNLFSEKRVKENYTDLIESEISKVLGQEVKISTKTFEDNTKKRKRVIATRNDISVDPQKSLPITIHPGHFLRKDFTFGQFVVGDNNDFAYLASLSLASERKTDSNVLFLLSETGLGKSHLTQSVGHQVLSDCPSGNVYYATAANFSSEMVRAFRQNSIEDFKNKYRKCDVLLLDDVQHLSGKERTQIELALIFDDLFNAGKKIIFSGCYVLID